MNTADENVAPYLKIFTLLDFNSIQEIAQKHQEAPEQRYGQKQLANYLVSTVYGKDAAQQALKISDILFGQGDTLQAIQAMSSSDLLALQKETGGGQLSGTEWKLIDLFVQSGLCESNGEAKKLIATGSLYSNEQKIEDIQHILTKDALINNAVVLRKGKKQYKVMLLKD